MNINFFIRFVIFNCILLFSSCNAKEKPVSKLPEKKSDVLELEKTITLPGVKGRIDHISVDPKNQLLFLAAFGNNSVEVADIQKGERIKSITGIEEPQGIIYIAENNSVCVTSGGTGNCSFYDCTSFDIIAPVYIGADADNIRYDSPSGLLYAGFGEGGIAVIDALKQSVISSITFKGHPEGFQVDNVNGRIFINVPDSKSIIIANKNSSEIQSIKMNGAASNFPMSIDSVNHRLFIGCRKPELIIVYDTELLQEVSRFEIKQDVDDIFFDNVRKLIYLSCGEGFLEVLSLNDNDNFTLLQDIVTSKGARTSFFSPWLDHIFVAAPNDGYNEAKILVFKFISK